MLIVQRNNCVLGGEATACFQYADQINVRGAGLKF